MPLVQRLCPLPLSKSGTSGYIFGMKPLRDSGSLGSMRLSIRALGLVSGLLVSFLAVALLSPLRAHAQAYDTAELEALLAPVALQPDAVLWQVLDAATTPNEVQEAAAWSQANPGIEGSDAVRAVQDYDWQPAVKTLVAYPDLLARMAESPQWLEDLGEAYARQQADVLAAVQTLRQRAQASGHLQSDAYQSVQVVSGAIAVQPAVSYIYAVRYYDPFVVFGHWHWRHRPVHWRPWHPKPVFVRPAPKVVVHRQPPKVVVRREAPVVVHPKPGRHLEDRHARLRNGPPSPAELQQRRQSRAFVERQRGGVSVQPFRRIPEANRRPIVQSFDRRPSGIRPLPGSRFGHR